MFVDPMSWPISTVVDLGELPGALWLLLYTAKETVNLQSIPE